MYRKSDGQISIAEFMSPFGKLDGNNRWVKKAAMIPWGRVEEKYASLFKSDTGNVAKPVRMALGTQLIKEETGFSDEDILQNVLENPYMQYFIGLHEFTTEPPFAATTMVYFRKRLTAEIMAEINEMIFAPEEPEEKEPGPGSGDEESGENKGVLMLDATCVPADITYPTDTGLLNEAREKLEHIIDALHAESGEAKKPRTYRKKARKEFLGFSKSKRKSGKQIRKAVRKQLGYVRRDLGHIERMLEKTDASALPERLSRQLETIRTVHEQQEYMYVNKTHKVTDRIVSISQPYVRPIVRGKKNAPVEFGAKVSVSLVDGYAFVDKIGWDNYSEAELLPQAVKAYRRRFGCYPEAVLADKLYRNRENLRFCREKGIRLSGPRLGRPPKDAVKDSYEAADSAQRNWIEGKFGEGKTRYGLGRLFARLQGTCETAIQTAILAMNLNRKMRVILRLWLDAFLFRWNYSFGAC